MRGVEHHALPPARRPSVLRWGRDPRRSLRSGSRSAGIRKRRNRHGGAALALPDGNAGVALPQPLDPSDAVWCAVPSSCRRAATCAPPIAPSAGCRAICCSATCWPQRYLGRFHRATPAELTDWLGRYANQPDAPAIHALLLRRLPQGASAPAAAGHRRRAAARTASSEPPPPPVADGCRPPLPRQPALERAAGGPAATRRRRNSPHCA